MSTELVGPICAALWGGAVMALTCYRRAAAERRRWRDWWYA